MNALGNRLLIVHSDSGGLRERARYFSALGFEVTTAGSASEAIEATANRDFDLAEICLDPAPATTHLRCYLEKRYRDISVFVPHRAHNCRNPGPRRPARCPDPTESSE